MRIGIDFDNTIVCYDELFHNVARESALIPPEAPVDKTGVRNHLLAAGREDDWTRLQGLVYGARIVEARPYHALRKFMQWSKRQGHELFIISHRTKTPALGPAYDLHQAGRSWVDAHLGSGNEPLVSAENVFFETEKAAKVARIRDCGCALFIDDLPEILLMEGFPSSTARILFDPAGHHAAPAPLIRARSWEDILIWTALHGE